MTPRALARLALGTLVAAESAFALQRWSARRDTFATAAQRARALGRPLLVIGDPDAGAHTRLLRAYGCGDLCLDLRGCPRCPNARAVDITLGPLADIADDSAVVFVSCVLEYVIDLPAARAEVTRIAGHPDNLFTVTVQPWTFTAALYPGARWSGTSPETMKPVTTWHKLAATGLLSSLTTAALWPRCSEPA